MKKVYFLKTQKQTKIKKVKNFLSILLKAIRNFNAALLSRRKPKSNSKSKSSYLKKNYVA